MDMEKLMEEVSKLAVQYGIRIVGALILLFVAWMVAAWVGRLTRKGLERAKIDVTLTRFLAKIVRWIVLILALLACLSIFGIQTTSFAAVIGAAGLAVGLAFQGTLGNFAAGAMLLIFRPFKVGDVVNLAGQTGKVWEIDIFSTVLDTFDNRRITIPNGSVFGSTIENINFHPHRRADVDVGVAYDADIDQTREVLMQAARSVPDALAEPEPAVILLALADSSVNWSVRIWAKIEDFGSVKQGTIRAVKNALDEAGIGIPFPQLDVHLDKAEGSAGG